VGVREGWVAMMSGAFRAVVTATAATGVGITAFGDRPLLVGTVTAIGLVFSVGWPALLGLPARTGATVVLALTTLAATAAVELTGDVAWVAIVFAFAVLGAFVHELLRRDGRPRLLESVSGVVGGAAIVSAGTGWLAVGTSTVPLELLLSGAVTLALAAAVTAAPVPGVYSAVLTIVLAAVGGTVIGYLLAPIGMTTGLLVGLAAGILIATVHHLFGQFPSSGRIWPALAAAMLAVSVSGLPVYVLGILLLQQP
jgi:hypothetical protein